MPETCIWFGELGARVMIEDKEVEHYNMQVDPARREVTCWIASEAGKAFSVVWLEFDVEYPSKGKLFLDGHYTGVRQRRSAKPIIFQHMNISDSSCVPFLFSPVVVTDDDTYLDSPSHSIGEIKLDIVRTSDTVTTVHKGTAKKPHTYLSPPHLQEVHERSKKATAHRVNYGSEIPRPNLSKPRNRQMPKCSASTSAKTVEKLVTFVFKYRSLEMLHANGIVPRNLEPLEPQEHALDTPPTSETSSGKGEHSKVEKEVESGTNDEDSMREKALLAELQRCQAEIERIRKGRKDSERPKKRLKKEHKPLFLSDEIIDLT